ncbi:uncharacterized protein LOC127628391 [Xyrauchen texanus]|uniref:uncharacterized protein LOC127628391 n=1 Tax=Xyrauchen texanus TaxID=154827 RepID=UPI002242A8E1|nr:uncharacterized protein LOC127628391 [Xyrauchen texanus]
MVVPTERMNELWKRMALVLVFAILLLHSCQAQDTTPNPPVSGSTAGLTSTAAPGDIKTTTEQNNATSVQSSTPLSSAVMMTFPSSSTAAGLKINSQTSAAPSSVIPGTDSWTTLENNQTVTHAVVHSSAPSAAGVEEPSQSKTNNNSNKESQTENEETSSSSAVFVSVLMSGLLLAAIIIGIYYFKCHRQTSSKGIKLAEESLMADEENQGNTMVSVAPLNQLEPKEKPSLNGESTEAVKTQTPPAATNGHSTTKTADTEL